MAGRSILRILLQATFVVVIMWMMANFGSSKGYYQSTSFFSYGTNEEKVAKSRSSMASRNVDKKVTFYDDKSDNKGKLIKNMESMPSRGDDRKATFSDDNDTNKEKMTKNRKSVLSRDFDRKVTFYDDNGRNLKYVAQSIISSVERIEKEEGGYLIYDCTLEHGGDCGGWGDRVSGMLTTLLLSIITGKKFRINFDTPCTLDTFFAPNHVNWIIRSGETEDKNSFYYEYLNSKSVNIFDVKKMNETIVSPVSYIRFNWDLTDILRDVPSIRNKIPWICDVHYADLYKLIFHILFKPKPRVLDVIAASNVDRSKKLLCAHVRIGSNMYDNSYWPDKKTFFSVNKTNILLEFFKKFDKKEYQLFIASDSSMLKNILKAAFHQIIEITGDILHVEGKEREGKEACDSFGRSLADFLMLSSCDVLLLTRSGFGVEAAYLRDNNKPLYCVRRSKYDIVPCSRYNVEEIYRKSIHVPNIPLRTQRHDATHNYCYPVV